MRFIAKVMQLLLTISSLTNSLFDDELDYVCEGETIENVTLAAYYPNYLSDDRESSIYDVKGHDLHTLQDYLDDRNEFVTLSMDESLVIPYASPVCIPELNQHFGHFVRIQVRDSSSDLFETGYTRADICVRSEMDSYDVMYNRKVTLVFNKHK